MDPKLKTLLDILNQEQLNPTRLSEVFLAMPSTVRCDVDNIFREVTLKKLTRDWIEKRALVN